MKMQPYIVYIKTDRENRITAVHSSAFVKDTEGWTEIDSGFGDRYHHAQGNYFAKPIMDERGVWRYAMRDGRPVERAAWEMEQDFAALPAAEETNEELLLEVAADHEYRLCLLEMGIDESEVMEDDV